MKLILMRHAKSSHDGDAPTDHARPLNKRGRRDAPKMAVELLARIWEPRYVLASDSERTRETWLLMEPLLPPPAAVDFRRELYHAGLRELRSALQSLEPGNTSPVLALGHNPGWEAAASHLADEDIIMPTACCVLLESSASDWTTAFAGDWRLVEVMKPT